MNIALIEAARERIPSVPILVNMVSKRVRQLNGGDRPYVKPNVGEEKADVALREIAEGKFGYAMLDESAAQKDAR
ncbi:MAG: DNA-directed RNA polymerase subunit omega [Kiritimatiellia bacterium]